MLQKFENKRINIEDKSNNQSKATIIFSELINQRKGLIKKLYDGVDNNNLKFEYAGPAKDVRFCEYKDSREHFDAIKDSQIKFREVKNLQNEFLNKLSDIKIGKKTTKQKETINNIEKKKRLLNFLEAILKCYLMQITMQHKMKLMENGKGIKILTPKQKLQRLPIALAQVKAGNNSKSLLNEIRQIVYSLYQSKQITKKLYNNIIKSINIRV